VLREREATIRHLVHLAEKVILVVCSEVLRVEDVLPHDVRDLVLEAGGIRVATLERRRQEAADHDAVQRSGREGAGNAEDDRRPTGPGHEVPEPRRLDRGARRDEASVVGVVRAVAEAVDAEIAGRPARHHAGPGRNRDRRDDRGQASVRAPAHETGDRRELIAPALEDE
jgi:hypothetical protein